MSNSKIPMNLFSNIKLNKYNHINKINRVHQWWPYTSWRRLAEYNHAPVAEVFIGWFMHPIIWCQISWLCLFSLLVAELRGDKPFRERISDIRSDFFSVRTKQLVDTWCMLNKNWKGFLTLKRILYLCFPSQFDI